MSHAYYNEQWKSAVEDIHAISAAENPSGSGEDGAHQVRKDDPISWAQAFKHFVELYVKYVQVFRKLEACHDQIVHPQKRRDVRVALETVMGRLCQVKGELSRFGRDGVRADYLSLEEHLAKAGLPPSALELPIPRFFVEKNVHEVADSLLAEAKEVKAEEGKQGSSAADGSAVSPALSRAMLDKLLPDAAPEEPNRRGLVPLTVDQAVAIIQRHERGRQGKARALLMRSLRMDLLKRGNSQPVRDPVSAALTIQRVWRAFRTRRRAAQMAREELVFIGMLAPSAGSGDAVERANAIAQARRQRREDNELKYAQALVDLRHSLKHSEGPRMREELWEERYRWWIEQKEKTGEYPDDFTKFYQAKNGTLEEEEGAEAKEEKKGAGKASAKAGGDKKKDAKGGKGKAAESGAGGDGEEEEDEEEDEDVTSFQLSSLVGDMEEIVQRFHDVWLQLDEIENPNQGHDNELARSKLRPLVLEEVRQEVDVKLLEYLANIRAELEAAKKGKKKKGKEKKKKKKPKKDKAKKKKLSEGEKACVGMSLEDMMSALVRSKIAQRVSPHWRPLSDFKGDPNPLGALYDKAEIFADPSASQLRECVTSMAILPLGSEHVHRAAPLVNSLLLFGPAGSGKTMLSRAIALHANATLLDLSPKVLGPLLSSKQEAAKVIHMAFTVAKACQPAVIYIDDIEQYFAAGKGKKKSGAGGSGGSGLEDNLARARPLLAAQKAELTEEHRVLIVGNSRDPCGERVDRGELLKFFAPENAGRALFTPCPDYAARVKIWRAAVIEAGFSPQELSAFPRLSFSALAQLSEGFSAGSIRMAVELTLPPARVRRAKETMAQICTGDFVHALSRTPFTYKDAMDAFREFNMEVTGEAARLRLKEEAARAAQDEAAGGGQSKAAKGKKKPAGKK